MKTRNSPKGRLLVGQSGGCTAVINKSLLGVIDAARASRSISDIWGLLHGIEGLLNEEFIDLRAQPLSLLKKIGELPSSVLGSARRKLVSGDEIRILEILKKHNIRYLLLIGGNDTADTILRVATVAETQGYDLKVIHIPKTIDNDLMETDHCPGYGSVARFAAITTQEAGLDTKSMKRVDPVKIIELMGRNSGWIVAASALLKKSESDPPHLLLVPEKPFHEAEFMGRVEAILTKVGYCIIVISETIRDVGGNRIGKRLGGITQDSFGHQYVEGAANFLAMLVEDKLKIRARFDKPGTIQRMSMSYVSTVDQEEAYNAGVYGVRWAVKGISKVMVSFVREPGKYRIEYKPVSLGKIPNRERYLPKSFLNKSKDMITGPFRDYALPLIGQKLPDFSTLQIISPKS